MDEKTYELYVGRLVRIFYDVRNNYPYGVSETLEGPPYDCEDKCKTFIELVERLNEKEGINVEVRPRYCMSGWSLFLPEEVTKSLSKDSVGHYYPEIKIPKRGSWVPVDATFDAGLKGKNPGIAVNEWNGYTDTVKAFPPIRICTPKKSLEELGEVTTEEEYAKDWEENGKFYNALNQYLEELRNK